ncbi:hypothetical protein K438DRAFT_1757819 [Mycena galopus ATCC 62051]|nr:hypothetical protein K438DRAFT_1757819 [Mycena galopus ATCC 62051]
MWVVGADVNTSTTVRLLRSKKKERGMEVCRGAREAKTITRSPPAPVHRASEPRKLPTRRHNAGNACHHVVPGRPIDNQISGGPGQCVAVLRSAVCGLGKEGMLAVAIDVGGEPIRWAGVASGASKRGDTGDTRQRVTCNACRMDGVGDEDEELWSLRGCGPDGRRQRGAQRVLRRNEVDEPPASRMTLGSSRSMSSPSLESPARTTMAALPYPSSTSTPPLLPPSTAQASSHRTSTPPPTAGRRRSVTPPTALPHWTSNNPVVPLHMQREVGVDDIRGPCPPPSRLSTSLATSALAPRYRARHLDTTLYVSSALETVFHYQHARAVEWVWVPLQSSSSLLLSSNHQRRQEEDRCLEEVRENPKLEVLLRDNIFHACNVVITEGF